MDYTTAPDFVAHAGTGNRMHTDIAAIPTDVAADDLNMVIWSLMEVVKGGGETPTSFDSDDPTTYQRLLKAIEYIADHNRNINLNYPEVETPDNKLAIIDNGDNTITINPDQEFVMQGKRYNTTDYILSSRTFTIDQLKEYHLRFRDNSGFVLIDNSDITYNQGAEDVYWSGSKYDDMLVARVSAGIGIWKEINVSNFNGFFSLKHTDGYLTIPTVNNPETAVDILSSIVPLDTVIEMHNVEYVQDGVRILRSGAYHLYIRYSWNANQFSAAHSPIRLLVNDEVEDAVFFTNVVSNYLYASRSGNFIKTLKAGDVVKFSVTQDSGADQLFRLGMSNLAGHYIG